MRHKANGVSFKNFGMKTVFEQINALYQTALMKPQSVLKKNFKMTTLLKLRRTRCSPSYQLLKPRKTSSDMSDFDPFNLPINFHYHWLSELKCDAIRETATNIMAAVVSLIYTHIIHIDSDYRHDFTRQCLAVLDKQTFLWSNEETTSSVGSLLHGLSNMGGPRGWEEQDIIDNCTEWVQGDTQLGKDPESQTFISDKLDKWTQQWSQQITSDKLSFQEFVTDPMKWGTSGGAPAKEIAKDQGHEKVRSKWAWALSNLSSGKDIYKEAMSEKQTCSVALKEEAKTRMVITTPMSAYLRQSYIWYRLGRPAFLKSTLTDPGLLNTLATTTQDQYICVDSSKFDYNVPGWFFFQFYDCLKRHVTEIAKVRSSARDLIPLIDDEIAMFNDLHVQCFNQRIKWRKGLLSGWRFTSLWGSMVSAMYCEMFKEQVDPEALYAVQGDDIFIMPSKASRKETCIALADKIGLKINYDKSSSSSIGEFLKYRYHKDKVDGYPARTVRSMFFANPWMDKYAIVNPSQISGAWWMYLSRLTLCANCPVKRPSKFISCMASDITSWWAGRHKKQDILKLLKTPASSGGLGVLESIDYTQSSFSSYSLSIDTRTSPTDAFLSIFGAVLPSRTDFKIKNTSTLSLLDTTLQRIEKEMDNKMWNNPPSEHIEKFPEGYNYFAFIVDVVDSKVYIPVVSALKKYLKGKKIDAEKFLARAPRLLRCTRNWKSLIVYLTGRKFLSFPPSCYVDNRYDGNSYDSLIHRVTANCIYTSKNLTLNKLTKLSLWACAKFIKTQSFIHSL